MEQPMFNEAALSALGSTQFRTKKEVFSREEALAEASPTVRESFLALFSEIDRLDYMICEYDLLHGRRIKPIRAELVKRFSEEERAEMRERVTHWNQYHYLKQRHMLVEMRREQYTLRDSYREVVFSPSQDFYQETPAFDFDAGIEVLPLGLKQKGIVPGLLFRKWEKLNPWNTPEEHLQEISQLYWKKKQFAPGS